MSAARATRAAALAGLFRRDVRGASAIEFAIVALPFFAFVLSILQVGIYYMTQASLDAGVIRSADALRNGFAQSTAPVMPDAATLKGNVATLSGGMINNDATLAVEIRQLSSLAAGSVAVTDGTADYGSARSALVLRAEASVVTFAPGFSSLAKAASSAIVRRQGR